MKLLAGHRTQMSKTTIAVKNFVSGGRESLETAVYRLKSLEFNRLDSYVDYVKDYSESVSIYR
jgi:hypothetical protein